MFYENDVDEHKGIEEMKIIGDLIGSIIFHIETIKETNDLEMIKTSILCIEDARSKMPSFWKQPNKNVKIDIRNGKGDFKAIQRKCIALGVV